MYNYGMERHKVFISYYHHDDQYYKNYIENNLSEYVINKSVKDGEINSDNSTEYIKRLIQRDYISSSSVIVVLVGKNTKTRKFVDWEIYAGLRSSMNGSAGLVGILLPGMDTNNNYSYDILPDRLKDNVVSKYAKVYTWDYAIKNYRNIIQTAFNDRINNSSFLNNSRQQMKNNTTGYY